MSNRVALLLLTGLSFLAGCNGCTPDLPGNNNDNDPDPDPPDVTDSGDGDTGPPPPCSVPEVEPNNNESQAQDLPLGAWACGYLDTQGDVEFFRSRVTEDGWMRVWVRASDIGSTADVALVATSERINEFGEVDVIDASSTLVPSGTDARLVLPVQANTTWTFQVLDEVPSYSSTHEWELVANMTKDPVECSFWEEEGEGDNSNNALTTPEPVAAGDQACGFIDSSTDQDFFALELPPGKSTITARVVAWNEGSPVNTDLALYEPGGTLALLEVAGDYSTDLDPLLEYTTNDGGTWYLRVRPQAGGGALAWYMLDVQVDSSDGVGDSGASTR